MRLHLIRHGQSSNNALPEYQRVHDPHLTDVGQLQAERLGAWAETTELDVLLVSPFRRTLQTAAPIRRVTRLAPRIWTDLHERGGCYSGWQPSNFRGCPGFTDAEIREFFPDAIVEDPIDHRGWWRSRDRESDDQAIERAARVIDRLKRTFLGTSVRIACVMHADFKKLVTAQLFDRDHEPHLPSPYRNASISTIDFAPDGRAMLVVENDVAHLDPSLRT
ncbi:MAG TPA: hypothetical protein DCQ98_03460 [Planctomycetaceae bacterium]|nr:hypothetical protein [Planctomycetaceae bacterium]HRF02944.1 histidine phosphatase family protein [Pirellulaceae bacterium]